MPLERELHEDRDVSIAQPVGMRDLERSPRRRVALDLAALDREHRLARSFVAHDQLELRLEHVVHDRGIDRGGRANPGRRQRRLKFLGVGKRFDRRCFPHEDDVDQRVEPADPIELGGLEAHALGAELLVERDRRRADADDGAVLGRDVEDRVHRQEAAGAGLVLRHDRGLSRDVLAEMAGEQPSEGVVAAAGRVADDEVDGLAGVELFGCLRRRLGNQTGDAGTDDDQARA